MDNERLPYPVWRESNVKIRLLFVFVAVLFAAPFSVQAVDYVLTSDGWASNDLSATPGAMTVSGDGGSGTPYLHGTYSDNLDMDEFQIFANTNDLDAIYYEFNIGTLTYDTNSVDGGLINFSGIGDRPVLTIDATNTITIRAIDSSSTGHVSAVRQVVNLYATNGITVHEGIDARSIDGLGGARCGGIGIYSGGPVVIGGELKTGPNRYPGDIEVIGASINLGSNIRTHKGGSDSADPADVMLNATDGGVVVNGWIGAWGANDGRGHVTILSGGGGDVTISSGITNSITTVAVTKTNCGGDVSITSDGDITIGGLIDSCAYVPEGNYSYPGSLYLSASNGAITLADLDVSLHSNITFTALDNTTITNNLLGLNDYLSGDYVTRFTNTTITGDIVYNPDAASNAYLNEATYIITGSEAYSVRPPPPSATCIMLK